MIYKVLILILTTLIVSCSRWTFTKVTKLEEFGSIKVGDTMPSFIGYSVNNKIISQNSPKGRFYIHFFNDSLPVVALNEELGSYSKIITDKGGVLMGGSDLKLAKVIGLRYESKKEWGGNYRYYLDQSLVVCTDSNTKIISIYKNVKKSDFEYIVDDIKDYH